MNLITEQVQHSRFGLGTIQGQTASTVEVRFDGAFGIKKFVYPSAFESFLILCRPMLRESMNQELTLIREQVEAERQRQSEADRLREEAVRTLLAQHLAAKKTTKPKSTKTAKTARTGA